MVINLILCSHDCGKSTEKGITTMLFGSHQTPFVALLDNHPIGTRLQIGVDSSFWVGNFAGIRDCVVILTDAQLFANVGKPIDGISPVVRIPFRFITFVGQVSREDKGGKDGKDGKDGKKE